MLVWIRSDDDDDFCENDPKGRGEGRAYYVFHTLLVVLLLYANHIDRTQISEVMNIQMCGLICIEDAAV